AVFDAGDLLRVILVGVLANSKELLIGKITRIDPHLVDVLSSLNRRGRTEVNVGYERHLNTHGPQAVFDLADRLRVRRGGGRDANDLAAGFNQTDRLRKRGNDVLGTRRRHRLDADWLTAAHGDSADLDFAGFASLVSEAAGAVGERWGC